MKKKTYDVTVQATTWFSGPVFMSMQMKSRWGAKAAGRRGQRKARLNGWGNVVVLSSGLAEWEA